MPINRTPTLQSVAGAPAYAGQAGKYTKVNAGETGLDFGAPGGGGGLTIYETVVATPQQNTTYEVTHDALALTETGILFAVVTEAGLEPQTGGGAVPDWVLDTAGTKSGHFTVAPTPGFGVTPAGVGSILTIGAEVGNVVTWPADPTVADSVVLDAVVNSGSLGSLTNAHTFGVSPVTDWTSFLATHWKARRKPGSTTKCEFRWTGGGAPPANAHFQVWIPA